MIDGAVIWSVGHSTRSLDELISLLTAAGVRVLADVRRVPRSRRHPQFRDESLARSLPAAGVEYAPMPDLGGLRKPLPPRESHNGGWRVEGFRGYADYMQTGPFEEALGKLQELARRVPTAFMCAEALPWRCHRSLIADALVARGWTVLHLVEPGAAPSAHSLRGFARVEGTRVTYPAAGGSCGEQGGFAFA
jgi:uncharacterized protein (DUF488 family)